MSPGAEQTARGRLGAPAAARVAHTDAPVAAAEALPAVGTSSSPRQAARAGQEAAGVEEESGVAERRRSHKGAGSSGRGVARGGGGDDRNLDALLQGLAARGTKNGTQRGLSADAAAGADGLALASSRGLAASPAGDCPRCGGRKGSTPCLSCSELQLSPAYDPALSLIELDLEEMDELLDEQPLQRTQRPRRPLSAAHRAKISAALRGKYTQPKSEEHRRKISRAMQRMYTRAKEPKVKRSAAAVGKPKVCSLCGGAGHNRRTCTATRPDAAAGGAKAVAAVLTAAAPSAAQAARARPQVCGLCGQDGHNRRSCPHRNRLAPAPPRTPRMYKCSYCGAPRHDVRNCPRKVADQAAAAAAASGNGAAADALQGGALAAAPEVGAADPSELSELPAAGAALRKGGGAAARGREREQGRVGKEAAPALPQSDLALPGSMEEAVDQAVAAVVASWRRGVLRQRVDLLLPLIGAGDEGATWPGGIRQQFRAALPVIEALLRRLKATEGLQGRIMAEWLDEADGCAAWQSDKLVAVVFPTADTLPALRELAASPSAGRAGAPPRLVLTINPQWTRDGQIVSDFGFGQARRDAERFIDSFAEVYCLYRTRVLGDDVRLLRAHPGRWQVYYAPPPPAGAAAPPRPVLLARERERPPYEAIVALLKRVPGTRASMSWLDRVLSFRGRARGEGGEGRGAAEMVDGEHPLLALAEAQQAALLAAARTLDGPARRTREADIDPLGAAALHQVEGDGALAGEPLPPPPAASAGALGGAAAEGVAAAVGVAAVVEGNGVQAELDGVKVEGVGAAAERGVADADVDAAAAERGADESGRFGELDIITGQPVRDLKLEPLRQLASWGDRLFRG